MRHKKRKERGKPSSTGKNLSKPTECDGIEFDSIYECSVWQKLKAIASEFDLELERQVDFTLLPAKKPFGRKRWVVDFVLKKGNFWIPVEVKGSWVLKEAGSLSLLSYKMHLFSQSNPELWKQTIIYTPLAKVAHGLRRAENYQELHNHVKELLKDVN